MCYGWRTTDWPKMYITGIQLGKRSRGRLNKRWMDCVEEDLWRAGVTKCGKTSGRERMTLNDIAADRQPWRNLMAASMAEICWTMIVWPDCNIAMSFAVTQLNQLLFLFCNQHWCFYRNYWVSKIYEQWLNNRQPESNRLLESELVNNKTWKYRVYRIPEIPRWRIRTKSNNKARAKTTKPGQTLGLSHWPVTRPDPAKIVDPVTWWPSSNTGLKFTRVPGRDCSS